MDYRTYQRRQFRDWKKKVKNRLPELVIAFYEAKQKKEFIDYGENEKTLGKVIFDINNYRYALVNSNGKLTDEMCETTLQICLELNVNDIFKFVKTLKEAEQNG